MPQLRGRERAGLPDSAFAYVDSSGRRSLPIHDEAHVRNALARFDRVSFEDDAARDRARTRLLRAARRHGIDPGGFVAGQLRPARKLPTGRVTLLMTDLENSTGLVAALGDRYPRLLADARRLVRVAVRRSGGREVDARADEFFAAFAEGSGAVQAAIAIRDAFRDHPWPDARMVGIRIGVHTGRPALTPTGYVGIAVNTVARVCAEAGGGQVLVTRSARDAAGEGTAAVGSGCFVPVGVRRLRGIPDAIELLEVVNCS